MTENLDGRLPVLQAGIDLLGKKIKSFLELFDGAITNVENEKTYHLKYSRTEYDLKDQLIRETIMNTQSDVEEIKEDIEGMDNKLDELQEMIYELKWKNYYLYYYYFVYLPTGV